MANCRYCTELDVNLVSQKLGLRPELPLQLQDVALRAVVTGVLTEAQKKYALAPFHERRQQVASLLEWYEARKEYLPHAQQSEENLAGLPEDDAAPAEVVLLSEDDSKSGGEFGSAAGLGSAEDVQEGNHAFNILATAPVCPPSVEAASMLRNTATNVEEKVSGAEGQRVHVSASNRPVSDWDKDFLTQAFIELFPFARGGPNEDRVNPVSLASCVQHYMRLSTRQFLGHRFVLSSYGIIARSLASSTAFVKAKHRTGSTSYAEAFASLSPEQVQACATYLEECGAARKCNSAPPPVPPGLSGTGLDKQFFESVRASCAAMPHTHEAG